MTTSTMPFHDRVFQIDFDFLDHRLNILVNDGRSRSLPLRPRSVADFYHEFIGALSELGIEVQITQSPVEVEQGKPIDQDRVHNSYHPDSVTRWWRILVQTDRLLQQFRASFVGKSSPVLFWWGSFDLSEQRFSGRPAPPRRWPARWMALAADQKGFAAGFWPGNPRFPDPAFFAFTSPGRDGWGHPSLCMIRCHVGCCVDSKPLARDGPPAARSPVHSVEW